MNHDRETSSLEQDYMMFEKPLLTGFLGSDPVWQEAAFQQSHVKRCLDFCCAAIMAMIFAPVFAAVVIVLLVRQGRPVFYVSERMKRPGQPFRLWKFRTMVPVADDLTVSGAHVGSRITPIGRVLRKTRLDELPQLWNILRGDMSFVGPRPPLRDVVEANPRLYDAVLRQRPGMTGFATLAFHAHEEAIMAACTSPEEAFRTYQDRCVARKARLDLIYGQNHSIGRDFIIVFQTLGSIALRKRL